MPYALGLIGMWIFTDGLFSLTLYLNAPSYDGHPKQTWRKDHWVRVVRMFLGIAVMVIGGVEQL